MRISDAIARFSANTKSASVAVGLAGGLCLVLALALNGRGEISNLVSNLVSEPALAFDGTASPSTAALTTNDGLRPGGHVQDGKTSALTALQYAAEQGQPVAQWKLGRMYADGDGVPRDDLRAFNYFSQIANSHPDEVPGTPQARFVANAFVALGHYYLTGIPNSKVAADASRGRDMLSYAATYFGDADAQYELGRLYLGDKPSDPHQAARWFQLAASRARRHAVPRQGRAAPGRARADVADAEQGLRRQRRSLDQAAL
jgi:uncharacterized protein